MEGEQLEKLRQLDCPLVVCADALPLVAFYEVAGEHEFALEPCGAATGAHLEPSRLEKGYDGFQAAGERGRAERFFARQEAVRDPDDGL